MTGYGMGTPEGTRDILFGECHGRREIQQKFSHMFSMLGYHEVITPGMEYYDMFSRPGASIPQQEMYKSTDRSGRILVFRPDSTLPIARMAASRLQGWERPLRLFYNQTIYRNRPGPSGRNAELPQMGIELLGASGLRADLEVISVAAQALSLCAPDFRIEIGHAQLFRVLVGRLPVLGEVREQIRRAIETKNYAALTELLDPLGGGPAVEAVKWLPRLFGGEEVLQEAEERYADEDTQVVLSYLKTLYTALQSMGLQNRLIVDLGLVQRNDYYTGVVFSAYMQEHGDAVLLGGRYDNLCEKFGCPMPAVGFAADLEALTPVDTGDAGAQRRGFVLVCGEPGYEVQAQQKAWELAKSGIRCELSMFDTREGSLNYAVKVGASKMLCVGKQLEEISLNCEKGEQP